MTISERGKTTVEIQRSLQVKTMKNQIIISDRPIIPKFTMKELPARVSDICHHAREEIRMNKKAEI